MYKVLFRNLAEQDVIETLTYIKKKLKNPQAAAALSKALKDAVKSLTTMPYINPVMFPAFPLKREIRTKLVKNYLVLYSVNEEKKTVTIERVLYARKDLDSTYYEDQDE